MSCKLEHSRPDWKAYTLDEMDAPARREAETHAASCPACQEEAAGLRMTLDAMAVLREEELPRRIAFVSDKVFEPTWWQRMVQSFRQPSFAAGGVIAVAILIHAFVRPVAAPVNPAAQVDVAAVEAQVAARVTQRVTQMVTSQMVTSQMVTNQMVTNQMVTNQMVTKEMVTKEMQAEMTVVVNNAVAKAVADTEKRDDQRAATLLAATERRYADAADFLNRQVTHLYALNTGAGVR